MPRKQVVTRSVLLQSAKYKAYDTIIKDLKSGVFDFNDTKIRSDKQIKAEIEKTFPALKVIEISKFKRQVKYKMDLDKFIANATKIDL